MKTTNKFIALALMALAVVFASCSKDDNDPIVPTQQEIEAKIVEKWKAISYDGLVSLTNYRVVTTYYADKTETMSSSTYIPDLGYVWDNKRPYAWSVEGNVVCEKQVGSSLTQFRKILNIDDNHISCLITKVVDDQGEEQERNVNIVLQKITADYSQNIIGMWEGTAMTGYETYGDYHHRIEYRADGTYTYYNWNEETQKWQPLEDVFDEWNVDGDWLATRWQNNGSEVMNYEWWDIDYIKQEGDETIMKWYALREKEDGTRFNTTFTWKKVK